jgi:hypothetical protein
MKKKEYCKNGVEGIQIWRSGLIVTERIGVSARGLLQGGIEKGMNAETQGGAEVNP